MKPSSQDIRIQVSDPKVVNSDSLLSYIVYQIVGQDQHGQFQVRQRYSDFFKTREKLVQRWPGLYIPPVASKKVSGNTQGKFIQLRLKFLKYFCGKMSERPYLFYSDIFQMFLRSSTDIEKDSKALPAIQYVKLLPIYQKYFADSVQMNGEELKSCLQKDFQFLKNIEKKMDKLRQQFRQVVEIKISYVHQLNHCMETILPQYQENHYIEHIGRQKQNLIYAASDKFTQKNQEYKNCSSDIPFDLYTEMVSYQLKEVRAFIQAFKSRKQAQQQKKRLAKSIKSNKQQLQLLKAGKTTFKSLILAKGSKDQQISALQQLIPKQQQQQQALNEMLPLMDMALFNELKLYKKKRGDEYVSLVKDIAKKQMKELYLYVELLKIPIEVTQKAK